MWQCRRVLLALAVATSATSSASVRPHTYVVALRLTSSRFVAGFNMLNRFQMREAKREQLVQLREKFEEDKAKVARMKAARVFKPF
jgi:Ribosomal RNA-processing protein 7 (RRP7) C-terminal domain